MEGRNRQLREKMMKMSCFSRIRDSSLLLIGFYTKRIIDKQLNIY